MYCTTEVENLNILTTKKVLGDTKNKTHRCKANHVG